MLKPDNSTAAPAKKKPAMEKPKPILGTDPDPQHHIWPSGDWRCGYCDNANRARFGQTERCNMRNCQVRFPSFSHVLRSLLHFFTSSFLYFFSLARTRPAQAPFLIGNGVEPGRLSRQQIAILELQRQSEEAEAEEEAAAAAAAGDLQGAEADTWEPKDKKKKKRESIYANQGGGLANPSKKKKGGKRAGDPGGQFGRFG